MKERLQAPSPAMFVAVVALVSSLAGGAVAATLVNTGDLKNGAVTKKKLHKNAVTSKKVKNKTLKAKDFADGQLEQGVQGIQGLKGDKGDPGEPGQDGADATNLWAVIDVNAGADTASILRGSGAVSTEQTGDGEGTFEVVFNRDVSACTYQGTLGRGDTSASPPGEISIVRRGVGPAAPDALYIRTFDSTGVLSDRSFHIAVFC